MSAKETKFVIPNMQEFFRNLATKAHEEALESARKEDPMDKINVELAELHTYAQKQVRHFQRMIEVVDVEGPGHQNIRRDECLHYRNLWLDIQGKAGVALNNPEKKLKDLLTMNEKLEILDAVVAGDLGEDTDGQPEED